jgi:hypothetical protein
MADLGGEIEPALIPYAGNIRPGAAFMANCLALGCFCMDVGSLANSETASHEFTAERTTEAPTTKDN